MENNNMQKAGRNSIQVQVDKIENNYGTSSDCIMLIIKSEIEKALKDNALVAEDIARKRLNEFSEIFLPKLVKSNLIECFSEPSIQMFFRNVEKTAICTDSKGCYEILSEILIHRANKKDDFTIIAATNKAIEVADKISDDALLFLTIFLCVNAFIPNSGEIKFGLKILDDLYEKVLNNKEIPYSEKIIDNLEVVGAIRKQDFLTYKAFDEFFPNELEGYSSAGIDKSSQNYQKAKELLERIGIDEKTIFSDSLIKNHIRINVVNRNELKNILISDQQGERNNNILNEIYDLYDSSDENKKIAKKEFSKLINNYPNIVKVKEWWDSHIVKSGVSITAIGRVLAHTNAKCLEHNIPDLD